MAVAIAAEASVVATGVAPVSSRHTGPARHAVHAVGARRTLRPIRTEDSFRAWWRRDAMRARRTGRAIGARRPQKPQPRGSNLPLYAPGARGPCDTILPWSSGGTRRPIASRRPRRSGQARIPRITCRWQNTSARRSATRQTPWHIQYAGATKGLSTPSRPSLLALHPSPSLSKLNGRNHTCPEPTARY